MDADVSRPAFQPPWWAAGPHWQTMTARILRPSAGPAGTRERLETPDGDFVDVDFSPKCPLFRAFVAAPCFAKYIKSQLT